jgi:polyphosphate kinase 2 (PPK2 family)
MAGIGIFFGEFMMNKNNELNQPAKTAAQISKHEYRKTLHALQIELVKLQRHFIKCNDKILIIFEGVWKRWHNKAHSPAFKSA